MTLRMTLAAGAATALTVMGMAAGAQEPAEFGTEEDTSYAADLWQVMSDAGLVGEGALMAFPYEGTEPHGALLETFYTQANVGEHEGELIVKRNYRADDLSVDDVLGAPAENLASITVMFKREEGYDAETNNWFWAKYLPDGTLDQNPAGASLAGLVGKNADAGCIACHQGAEGDDFIFTTDATLE